MTTMFKKLALLLAMLVPFAASAEVWQARYGVSETFGFKLYNADGTLDVDEADGGTEVSLSCNEGAETTATNDFVDEGTTYSITLTATEMQCERIAVIIAATTTEAFFIQTHSNASAMTPAADSNLVNIAGSAVSTSTAQLGVNVVNAAGTAWGSGAITAASIATDAIGAAEIAADAIGASEIAADAIGTSELATGAITSAEFASGAITAAAIATDAIGAAEIAADFTTEVQSGLATASALATVDTVVDSILDDTGTTGVLIAESTSNCREVLGCDTQGTLSGTHTTTTADLGTNAPSNDITGMTLVIPTHNFSRAISSYNTGTGVATWDTATAVTLANANQWYLHATAPSSGGGGLDAAGVRSAIGLASANLDTQLGTIDTNVDAILVDTSTTLDDLVDDLESRLGTPSNLGGGATVAANLSDIEGQTDDIGVAGAGLTATDDAIMTRVGAPVGASISADVAAVKSDSTAILVDTGTTLDDFVDDLETRLTATRAGYLDNLSAGAVATASALTTVDTVVDTIQVTTDKLDDTLELDSTVYRFTANSLETAPTGSGESLDAIADAVWDELLSGHAVSGSTGEALTSAAAGGGLDAAGVRAAIGLATANLDTQLADIPTVSEFNARSVTSATYATATALQTVDDNVDAVLVDTAEIGTAGAGLTAVDDAVLSAIAALNNLSSTQVRDLVIEDQGGGVSLGCAISVILAYASGDLATTGANSTYEDPSGTETRATGTVASNGNRTATITCPTY